MSRKRLIAVAIRNHDPFPANHEVLGGISRYVQEHPGLTCVIDEYPQDSMERGRVRYDGVIARTNPEMSEKLKALGVAFVNTAYAQANGELSSVHVDPAMCGQLAAEHFLERGFDRLLDVKFGHHPFADDLANAFARTAEEDGGRCAVENLGERNADERENWLHTRGRLAEALLAHCPPVGVLVPEPWVGRLLIALCGEHGWRIPQQVAIVCIENLKLAVEIPPQISTLDMNHHRVGYEAASLLDRMMEGDATEHRRIVVRPKGVIARESSSYFALSDEMAGQALRYIEEHLHENLSVSRIADAIAVSSRSLQRHFEAALNQSVGSEVRRLRLEKAKRMLGMTQMQISEVARTTGFKSLSTMGVVFQRDLGMSPRDYRKSVAGK